MEKAIADLLWPLVWGFELGWAVRIWWVAQHRAYPVLVTYLVLSAVQSAAAIGIIHWLGWETVLYLWMWNLSRPLLWLLMLAVLAESYEHIATGRLRAVGQWIYRVILLGGTVAALIAYQSGYRPGTFWIRHEETVYAVLGVVCWLIVGTVAVFRLKPHRRDAATFVAFALIIFAHVLLLGFYDQLSEVFADVRYVILPAVHIISPLIGAWSFGPNQTSKPTKTARQLPAKNPGSPERQGSGHTAETAA